MPGPKGDKGDRGPKGADGEVDEAELDKRVAAAAQKAGGSQLLMGWGAREKFTKVVADKLYAKSGAVGGGGKEMHITLAHSAEGVKFSS